MANEGPPFHVDPGAMEGLTALWSAGHGAYLVGGGVRDALLKMEVRDWDVATDARPERILRIFPGSTYQNRFGTVLARGLEMTTFRRDHRYADHRRPDTVVFSDDIYEDLARRDLTINAIAWGRSGPDATARLVDPADGQGDLEARLVRAVGDPGRRFDEDALRLLRAVRIAARLDFGIEPMTWDAMVAHVSDMQYVSEERIGSEVRRMLAAPRPSRACRLLLASGILAAVAPELAVHLDVTSERTSFDRAMDVLDTVVADRPGDEQLALAALLGWVGTGAARDVLDRLRVAGRDSDAAIALIAAADIEYRPSWSDADVRRFLGELEPDLLDGVMALRRARASAAADDDSSSERELSARIAAQRAADVPLRMAQLAIDGRDLRDTLGVPESPAIGMILARLMADVIEDPALNTRTTLLYRASMVLDELARDDSDGAGDTLVR